MADRGMLLHDIAQEVTAERLNKSVDDMSEAELAKDLEEFTALVLRVATGKTAPRDLIDEPFGQGPIDWAKVRFLGRRLAALLEMRDPPVFVVSLPRSGSSWIGEMLGSAADAAYLREPITQSGLAAGVFGDDAVTRYVDPESPPALFDRVARDAFMGLPNFPFHVVPMPNQWSLQDRHKRRLVMKEVNPLALQWITEAFRPKILLLLRHPVAVAQSRLRLGWGNIGSEKSRLFPPKLMARYPEAEAVFAEAGDLWETEGARQGLITRYALDSLENYKDWKIIFYEEFCRDPLASFEQLYRFCGLTMTPDVGRKIASHSVAGDRSKPYSRYRKSRAMEFAWKKETDPASIRKVRDFYMRFGLDFYAGE